MNPKLTLLAAGTGGVFSRQEALSCGYTARQIRIRLGDGRSWVNMKLQAP